jgi:hypothetical protein
LLPPSNSQTPGSIYTTLHYTWCFSHTWCFSPKNIYSAPGTPLWGACSHIQPQCPQHLALGTWQLALGHQQDAAGPGSGLQGQRLGGGCEGVGTHGEGLWGRGAEGEGEGLAPGLPPISEESRWRGRESR